MGTQDETEEAEAMIRPNAYGSQEEREAWMRERIAMQRTRNIRRRSRLVEEVLRAICQEYGIGRISLLGRTRLRTVAQARGEACRRLRALGLSFPRIGWALNLDHTTVMHHCRKGVL